MHERGALPHSVVVGGGSPWSGGWSARPNPDLSFPYVVPARLHFHAPRAHLSLFSSAGRVVASLRAQDPSLKLQAHLFKLLLTGYSIFYGSSIAFPCDRRAAIAIWHGTPSPPPRRDSTHQPPLHPHPPSSQPLLAFGRPPTTPTWDSNP
jgi:hypothetical protein